MDHLRRLERGAEGHHRQAGAGPLRRAFALLLALAAPAGASGVEGLYVLQGVREAAAAIELLPGGRFRFALTYGALDQHAEGRFRQEGGRILLTTEPAPKPPAFSVADVARGDPDRLDLLLVGPDGQSIPNIEMEILLANGARERAMTERGPIEIPLDEAPLPAGVRFAIPVFDVTSQLFRLDLERGHAWRFRLDPNDIGVRDFRDEAFTLAGDCLVPPGAAPGERLCREPAR